MDESERRLNLALKLISDQSKGIRISQPKKIFRSRAYYYLGLLYELHRRDIRKAKDYYATALESDPNFNQRIFRCACTSVQCNEIDHALEVFGKLNWDRINCTEDAKTGWILKFTDVY